MPTWASLMILSLFRGQKIAAFVHDKPSAIRISGLLSLTHCQHENGLTELAPDFYTQVTKVRSVCTVRTGWLYQNSSVIKQQLSAPSLPKTFVVNLLCTAEFDLLALFVFVCGHTGTGTVKSSSGAALKDYQCLCMLLSIYYDILHFFIACHIF